MNAATRNESRIGKLREELEGVEARKPGSGASEPAFGWFGGPQIKTELSPDDYNARKTSIEREIAELTKSRDNAFVAASKAPSGVYDSSMEDVEARRQRILSEGVKTGTGDGLTAEERVEAALARIRQAAQGSFPNATSAITTGVPRSGYSSAVGTPPPPPIAPQSPVVQPSTMSAAAGERNSEGLDEPLPGSRADEWEAHLRKSRSLLGGHGSKLGAVRTAAQTAATSRSIWRGSNQRRNGGQSSRQWRGDSAETSAMKSTSQGQKGVLEVLTRQEKRLERIEGAMDRIVKGD